MQIVYVFVNSGSRIKKKNISRKLPIEASKWLFQLQSFWVKVSQKKKLFVNIGQSLFFVINRISIIYNEQILSYRRFMIREFSNAWQLSPLNQPKIAVVNVNVRRVLFCIVLRIINEIIISMNEKRKLLDFES